MTTACTTFHVSNAVLWAYWPLVMIGELGGDSVSDLNRMLGIGAAIFLSLCAGVILFRRTSISTDAWFRWGYAHVFTILACIFTMGLLPHSG